MKNVILFVFAILSLVSVSCTKKEQPELYKWEPMPLQQVCNIDAPEVQILRRKGYTTEEAYKCTTPEGVAEVVILKSENYPVVSSLVMHKNQIILVERELRTDNTFDAQMTDLKKDAVFWTGNLPTNPDPDQGKKKPCKDRTTTFNGCAKCFVEVIGNHWIGIGIGLFYPEAVAAGIIIHCFDLIGD